MTAYFDALRRYFEFTGRSTRSQFWLYTLVLLIISIVGIVLDAALMIDPTGEALVITGLISLVHFIPSLSIMVRRLHDIDQSGWWVLIGVVPLLGQVVLLVFACTASTGPNRFGPTPGGKAHSGPYGAAGGLQAPAASAHLDQLEKLAALRASGALDDGEFARMKADLLARSRG